MKENERIARLFDNVVVVYFLKESFRLYPPCVAQVHLLQDAGVKVVVIAGSCPTHIRERFENAGVEVRIVGSQRILPGIFGKIQSYFSFRRKALRVFSRLRLANPIVWYGTADTAIALHRALRPRSSVASILELYDDNFMYRAALKRILPGCTGVIACEPTRADVMQHFYELKARPFVLPNKTYGHPRTRNLAATTQETSDAIGRMTSEKLLVYQGLITEDRVLTPLAHALQSMDDDRWSLYLLGPVRGTALDDVRRIYKNTYYLGVYPPPLHLEITSHATIGVAYYDRSSLNNILCAPNKIYEYTGFGIPVLANDVSCLRTTIGLSGAGLAVDFDDGFAIQRALHTIDRDYHEFSENATRFFEEADNLDVINDVLSGLAGLEGGCSSSC